MGAYRPVDGYVRKLVSKRLPRMNDATRKNSELASASKRCRRLLHGPVGRRPFPEFAPLSHGQHVSGIQFSAPNLNSTPGRLCFAATAVSGLTDNRARRAVALERAHPYCLIRAAPRCASRRAGSAIKPKYNIDLSSSVEPV